MAFTGSLNQHQLARVSSVGEEWMRVMLSTGRCDRPAAEAAVRDAYRAAGLDEPQLVVWADSPLRGALAAAIIRDQLDGWGRPRDLLLSKQLGDRPWNQLVDQLGHFEDCIGEQPFTVLRGSVLVAELVGKLSGEVLPRHLSRQLGDWVFGELGRQLRVQLEDLLHPPLGGQLYNQLEIQLSDQLRDQLQDRLSGPLRDRLLRRLSEPFWGQVRLLVAVSPWWHAYTSAFHTLASAIADLPECERLSTVTAAIRETGWWWPLREAVVLTDRPTILSRDRLGRLHNENGPALAYADGAHSHWWHGTAVPADLIDGDGWGPQRILTERNIEIRRCAIERLGWSEFITAVGLWQVGPTAPDPGNPGQQLALYDLPPELRLIYGRAARILLVTNASPDRDGSRRRFGLPVPAQIADPVTAAATLFDVSPEEYLTLGRAT